MRLDTSVWWKWDPGWPRVVVRFDASASYAGAEVEGDDSTGVRGLVSLLADEAKPKRGLVGVVLANRWVFALMSGVAASLIAAGILAWPT